MKRFIITKIVATEVRDNDRHNAEWFAQMSSRLQRAGDVDELSTDSQHIHREQAKGEIFLTPAGHQVLIANCAQAADLIGIQYEQWDRLHATIFRLQKEMEELLQAKRLGDERIRSAGWRLRLRWLFKGIK